MILSIDTSTKYLSAAVSDARGNLLHQIIVEADGRHSELLFDNIKLLQQKTGLNFDNLTKIVTTTGPGSFTGIRIGLAFAITVAQVYNIPIVAVSTLELLAYQVLFNEKNLPRTSEVRGLPEKFFICPMICSVQNEVYTSIYVAERPRTFSLQPSSLTQSERHATLSGKLRRISNYTVCDIDNIKYIFDKIQLHSPVTLIRPSTTTSHAIAVSRHLTTHRKPDCFYDGQGLQILFVGDGATKHLSTIKKTFYTRALISSEKNCIPNATTLIKISLLKKGTNPKNIKPIYIKPPRIHKLH